MGELRSEQMQWLILALGILAQALTVTGMKLSQGFTRPVPSVLSFVFWAIAFTILIKALKGSEMSYAFSLYVGGGVMLVTLIGWLFLKEPLSLVKIVSIMLIALGAAGLNLK